MSVCIYCGSQIKTDFASQALDRKYCNRECYRRGITQEIEKRILPRFCEFCKVELIKGRREGIKRWNTRRFCGAKCRAAVMFGAANGHWKGGRGYANQSRGKYVRVHDGPNQRAFEHRKIAERVLGRPLTHMEVVHHIDCDKTNNRHDNLLICTRGYHKWLHDEMGRRYAQEHFVVPSVDDLLLGNAC